MHSQNPAPNHMEDLFCFCRLQRKDSQAYEPYLFVDRHLKAHIPEPEAVCQEGQDTVLQSL